MRSELKAVIVVALAMLYAGCSSTPAGTTTGVGVAQAPATTTKPADTAEPAKRSRLQSVPRTATMSTWSLGPTDDAKVRAVIRSLMAGLEKRDSGSLAPLYMPDKAATYYSPLWASAGGAKFAVPKELHLQLLASCLDSFTSVRVTPDPEDDLRIGEGIAVWTGTGVNDVTHKSGAATKTNWRWTVVLEKDVEGNWLVTHEHSSFESAMQ